MRHVLAILLALTGAPVLAESFFVRIGDRDLGRLSVESDMLNAVLDNTPLGLADGRFDARRLMVATDQGPRLQYVSESDKRAISVLYDGRSPTIVDIAPASERTDLSQPGRVVGAVSDPVAVMAALVGASDGCPEGFRLYDGRRVTEARLVRAVTEGAELTCDLDYRVTAGPGHLSPFRFRQIDLRIVYDVSAVQRMTALTAEAGGIPAPTRTLSASAPRFVPARNGRDTGAKRCGSAGIFSDSSTDRVQLAIESRPGVFSKKTLYTRHPDTPPYFVGTDGERHRP